VPAGEVDVSRLIRDIVGPHVVPDADPRQDQLVASVEAAIADGLRRILGHPALRGLEATWRGIDWLVRSVETGESLTIHVLDVSKEELEADLGGSADDLSRSGLHRLLVEQGPAVPGGQPWSLIVGAYTFGPSAGDVSLLAGQGAVASRAGGPLLASASPSALGCESSLDLADPATWSDLGELGALWAALRASQAAPWIGLALPRILLRLPYGAATDEIDSFPFEEISKASDHEAHLWGNPAFGLAILIATAFAEEGWSMQPGSRMDLGDLPSYARKVDGETVLVPCAEVLLGERAADSVIARGLMPVLSVKGLPAVRVPRFQSIAEPPKALAGPWA
jgi:type VI secretion system protein ImpC